MAGMDPSDPNPDPLTLSYLFPTESVPGRSPDQPYNPARDEHLDQSSFDARNLQSLPIPPSIDDIPYLPGARSDPAHYNRPVFLQPNPNEEQEFQRTQQPGFQTLERDYTQPDPSFNPDSYSSYDRRVELENINWRPRSRSQPYYRPQTHTYTSDDVPPGHPAFAHPFNPPRILGTYSIPPSPSPTPPSGYESHHFSDPLPTAVPTSPFQSPRADVGPSLRMHLQLSPTAEVGLQSLPDPAPGVKPPQPLPLLIKLAIYGSPNKKLTLQEIYTALENRFEWFKINSRDKAWKNSIRHNLSLNKVFRSVSRPITEPGKGSYWYVDMSDGEGYKRPRKRKFKGVVRQGRTCATMNDTESSENDDGNGTSAGEIDVDFGHQVGEGRPRSPRRTYPHPHTVSRSPRAIHPLRANTQSKPPSGSSSGSMSPASTASTGHSASAAESTVVQGPRFHEPSFGQPSLRPPVPGPSYMPQPLFGQPSFGQPAFGHAGFARSVPLTSTTTLPPAFMSTGEYVPMSSADRSSASTYDRSAQMGQFPCGNNARRGRGGTLRHPDHTSSTPAWTHSPSPSRRNTTDVTTTLDGHSGDLYDEHGALTSNTRDDPKGR